LQVPAKHLARVVWAIVAELDVSAAEARYSSLGRHGYAPRHLLAVWVYASMVRMHYASVLARALKTDAALRLLAGGYEISPQTLRRFRQHSQPLFQAALEQTVRMAVTRGLLREDELAVDSMRLRAHASRKAVRTKSRSQQRVAELRDEVVRETDDARCALLEQKLAQHQQALRDCEEQGRTSLVRTNMLAGLIKFPNGGSAPGHRLTVTGSGRQARLAIGVLVDAAPNDYGHLQPAVEQLLRILERAGVPKGRLRLMGDAGYWDGESLAYAEQQRSAIEVLIAEQPVSTKRERAGLFQQEDFKLAADGRKVHCPAGKAMHGPKAKGKGVNRWTGDGCRACSLRDRCCTPGLKYRTYTASPAFEKARSEMRARLTTPEGRAAYGARMATIEPIFASLESDMGFRRASSRHAQTVLAEVLLKLLAHNLGRLVATRTHRRLFCAWLTLEEF
jgi:transposase